jgi:hypothetical protein
LKNLIIQDTLKSEESLKPFKNKDLGGVYKTIPPDARSAGKTSSRLSGGVCRSMTFFRDGEKAGPSREKLYNQGHKDDLPLISIVV